MVLQNGKNGFSEFRAQYVVNVATDQGHKHHVFYGRLQVFRFLLDLANAEHDQPVSRGAVTLPHSLGSKTFLDQAFVPCRQSRARRRSVACLFPLYESAEVTTMGPLKVSDTHCTLLLAAKPYRDFGWRRRGRGLRCAEDSDGTVNTRRSDHRRLG